MRKIIVFALAIALPAVAPACECAFTPLDTGSVRGARNVYIFRLLSAELQVAGSDQPPSAMVVGKIQVVDTIRGNTKAKSILYSTHQCCGTRLDVGKYYAVFTLESNQELAADSGNLLEVGEMYYPKHAYRAKIEAVLAGKRELDEVFSDYAIDRTQQIPRPPAPYCPPGSKRSP